MLTVADLSEILKQVYADKKMCSCKHGKSRCNKKEKEI